MKKLKPKSKIKNTVVHLADQIKITPDPIDSDFSKSGFSIEERAPQTTITTLDTPDQTVATEVPNIDKNSDLKIDTVIIDEDLPATEKSSKVQFILGSILTLLLIGASIFLAYLYYQSSQSPAPSSTTVTPAPTTTPAITPSPLPTPSIKNEDISFEILNATGISGQAAKYGKILEPKGYKINTLGNSDSKVPGLSIYLSSKLNRQKDQLLSDLLLLLPNATYSGELTDSESLVRLIIGK